MSRYNVKVIETPYTTEKYISSETSKVPKKKNNNKIKKKKRKFKEMTLLEQANSIQRKKNYYKNKRYEVARIVETNLDNDSKMLTLTFRDSTEIDITNYNEVKLEFDKFIKRLKRKLKSIDKELKYIAVHEIQNDRAAYHFHMILFDFPFISSKEIEKIWRNGFIKINKIPFSQENIRKTSMYITKYFSKETNSYRFQNKYYMTRNLKKPSITYVLVPEDELQEYAEDNIKNSTHFKKYKYTRPNFSSEGYKGLVEVETIHLVV